MLLTDFTAAEPAARAARAAVAEEARLAHFIDTAAATIPAFAAACAA